MPTYQYACRDAECGNRFELVQSFTDPAASECPVCQHAVRKVYGSVGVVFKGSGFYRNDSRAPEKSADSSSDGKGDSRGEAKTDAKTEGKREGKVNGTTDSGSGGSPTPEPGRSPVPDRMPRQVRVQRTRSRRPGQRRPPLPRPDSAGCLAACAAACGWRPLTGGWWLAAPSTGCCTVHSRRFGRSLRPRAH